VVVVVNRVALLLCAHNFRKVQAAALWSQLVQQCSHPPVALLFHLAFPQSPLQVLLALLQVKVAPEVDQQSQLSQVIL
jgi:hypothetical protein